MGLFLCERYNEGLGAECLFCGQVSIGRKNVQVNWGELFTNELRRFKGAVVDVFLFFLFVFCFFSARKTNAYENAGKNTVGI